MTFYSHDAPVTLWLGRLKVGDKDAVEQLWRQYFAKIAALAEKRLGQFPRRVFDEEDVALSVIDTVCRGAKEGRFPQLGDRSDLWALMVAITKQKAADKKRRHVRQKRGGGQVRGDSAIGRMSFDDLVGDEPTPEFVNSLDEQCALFQQNLADEKLRRIAQAKLQGMSNKQIADEMGVSTRTIQRKLQLIQAIWLEIHEKRAADSP